MANFDDIFMCFAYINEILQYTLATKKQLMLAIMIRSVNVSKHIYDKVAITVVGF